MAEHLDTITGVVFVQNDQNLITISDDRTARLWSANSGDPIRIVATPGGRIWPIIANASGAEFSFGTEAGEIYIGDGNKPLSSITRAHQGSIASLALLQDGSLTLSAGKDGVGHLWMKNRPAPIATYSANDGLLLGIRPISGDSGVATISSAESMQFWNLATGEHISGLRSSHGRFTALEADDLGKVVVTGQSDGTVTMWDVAPALDTVFSGHAAPITALTFSRSGTELVSGSTDHSVRAWNVDTKESSVIHRHASAVGWIAPPSETTVASVSIDGELVVTHRYEKITRRKILETTPLDLVFSSDGDRFWSLDGQGTAVLRETNLGGQLASFVGALGEAHLAANKDGDIAVTGDTSGTVRVWQKDRGVTTLHVGAIPISNVFLASLDIFVGLADGDILRIALDEPLKARTAGRISGRPVKFIGSTRTYDLVALDESGHATTLCVRRVCEANVKLISGLRDETVFRSAASNLADDIVAGGDDGIVRLVSRAAARSLGTLFVLNESVGSIAVDDFGSLAAVAGQTGHDIFLLRLASNMNELYATAGQSLTRQELTIQERSRFFIAAPDATLQERLGRDVP